MKKILHNVFIIVISSIFILINMETNSYASLFDDIITGIEDVIEDAQSQQKEETTEIEDIFTGADDFIQSGVEDKNITIQNGDLQNMSNLLYNTLLIIAIVVAVIVGMVIGIQFMTGSVEQKAKVKETLIPYIAGCIVIFGAFAIWKLVVTIMSEV